MLNLVVGRLRTESLCRELIVLHLEHHVISHLESLQGGASICLFVFHSLHRSLQCLAFRKLSP